MDNLKQLKVKSYKYVSDFQESIGNTKNKAIQYINEVKSSVYGFILFMSFIYMVNFAFTILVLRYL